MAIIISKSSNNAVKVVLEGGFEFGATSAPRSSPSSLRALSRPSKKPRTKSAPATPVYTPQPAAQKTYDALYDLYKKSYFAFGRPSNAEFGDVLPKLIRLAEEANSSS